MDSDQSAFVVIVVYDMSVERCRSIIIRALLFGLSGSVLLFNRVPSMLVAVARRWLAIPVHAFFDDFKIVDLRVKMVRQNSILTG